MLPGVEPLSNETVEVKAREVRQLWRVRLKISQEKGHSLEGAPELLDILGSLNGLTKLEQIGFKGEAVMGNVFFLKRTKQYIGTVFY